MNKTALITGGSSGIGYACVTKFLDSGYNVIATGRNQDKLKKLELELGGKYTGQLQVVSCDSSNEQDVIQLFQSIDTLDVLINNAGIYWQNDYCESSLKQIQEMFSANVFGAFLITKEALKIMNKQDSSSSIINISSSLGNKPAPQTSFYSASKAALQSLTQSIALEYAPKVRANAILPGVIKTPIHEKNKSQQELDEFYQAMADFHPLKTLGEPTAVAELCLQLTKSEMSFMTGSSILFDGGISLVC
ncbi:MAG: SDR family oxidoreductase [Candidatus Cloacimonetes bacterium]|nr:SDR family oxidoreductase [Candidatus Cloacimonadota bacterium]